MGKYDDCIAAETPKESNAMKATSLPSDILACLSKKFTAAEIQTIDANWDTYSNGFSLSSAPWAAIVREATMVLACSRA